jgi:hypothetical protein
MITVTTSASKSIEQPDEVRRFPNGRLDMVTVGGLTFARTVFEPGWRWSDSVKPIVGTDSCEFHHKVFIASGVLHVRMDDRMELDLRTGDVADILPGHDAWVVGEEPCVAYDFGEEDADYAKPKD